MNRVMSEHSSRRRLRLLEATSALVVLVSVAGCGGGSASGDGDLEVFLQYATDAQVQLFEAPPVGPTIEGLRGNTPNCALLPGSTLPPGVTLAQDSCVFQGASSAVGSYSGSVRLTVNGFKGEVTAGYGFTVQAPQLTLAGGGSPRVLTIGAELTGALATSQVAQLLYYGRQDGDTAILSLAEGRLPAGVVLELDNTGHILLKGAPSEMGRKDLKLAFTLRRAGHEFVTPPLALTLQVDQPDVVADYSACCTAFTGVPMSFVPATNFVPAAGASIRFEAHSGSLPSGLSLDPNTGEIRGTPTSGERSNSDVVVTATVMVDGVQDSTSDSSVFFSPVGVFGTYPTSSLGSTARYPSGSEPPYTVEHGVAAGLPFTIAPGPLYGARPGDSYRYRLVPNRHYAFGLPAWVTIDPTTGVLAGTKPNASDWVTFEVELTLNRGGAEYRVNQYWGIN